MTTSILNNVVYLDGRSVGSPATLAETFQLLERQPGSMAWIGLYRPAEAQLMSAAEQFGLHELAVEEAILAHQRPKLERYGDTLFVVLRSAHYRDETEEELQRYLRDVADHATAVVDQVDGFRSMLADILTVNATLVTQTQNEDMQRLAEASNAQNEELKKDLRLGRHPVRLATGRSPIEPNG